MTEPPYDMSQNYASRRANRAALILLIFVAALALTAIFL